MDPVETFEVDDKIVEIHVDDDPQNPRDKEYQDLCDMFILFHKRYNLGDKHDYKHENYSGWDEMERQIIKDLDPLEIRPLYMYEHSGITIADHPFSCPWDSGQIGFVLITKKSARETCMIKRISKKTREWAKKCLDASISEYDSYLRGECYGYVIRSKPEVEDEEGEELDSCWGFGGDIKYVREEATNAAKAITTKPKPEVENPNQLQLALNT